jgi:hypothetical protein
MLYLTESQIEEAKALKAKGLSMLDIAKAIGWPEHRSLKTIEKAIRRPKHTEDKVTVEHLRFKVKTLDEAIIIKKVAYAVKGTNPNALELSTKLGIDKDVVEEAIMILLTSKEVFMCECPCKRVFSIGFLDVSTGKCLHKECKKRMTRPPRVTQHSYREAKTGYQKGKARWIPKSAY